VSAFAFTGSVDLAGFAEFGEVPLDCRSRLAGFVAATLCSGTRLDDLGEPGAVPMPRGSAVDV
jgi:hypothetical protein